MHKLSKTLTSRRLCCFLFVVSFMGWMDNTSFAKDELTTRVAGTVGDFEKRVVDNSEYGQVEFEIGTR